jgi:hypothetical protein
MAMLDALFFRSPYFASYYFRATGLGITPANVDPISAGTWLRRGW